MPALGMAQDTGKLIAWLKQPGDAVAKGDVLFEVETDKSVAEVEAQHGGFLTDVTAAGGDDVPVGQVIAMISETAEDSAAPAKELAATAPPATAPEPDRLAAPAPDTGPDAEPEAQEAATPDARPASPAHDATPDIAPGSRIFASPKARRLADEQGLDLGRLAQAGHPQPYHVGDLEVLRNLPAGRNSPDATTEDTGIGTGTGIDSGDTDTGTQILASQSLDCQIAARVPRAGVADFLDWMERDGGVALPSAHLFVSFAARTLRAATADASGSGIGGALIVALVPLTGTPVTYSDPDQSRLSALRETDAAPDLTIRDLTASRLTSVRLAATDTPTLSIAQAGEDYTLTLDFTERQLSGDRAIAMMTDLADRLATPLLSVL